MVSSVNPSFKNYIVKCFPLKASMLPSLGLEGNTPPHEGAVPQTPSLAMARSEETLLPSSHTSLP